jgi:hypothetical protein
LRALDRALAVKPDDRPQTVAEFRSLLELDPVPSRAARKAAQPSERSAAGRDRPRLGLLAGIVAVLVGAIAAGAFIKWDKATPSTTTATPTPAPAPRSEQPREIINTPSAAVREDAPSRVAPPPPQQQALPVAPRTAPARQPKAAVAYEQPRPDNKLAALAAAFLQDGEKCFRAKQYDCAIAKANDALRVDPGSAPARQLRAAAAEEQQRALRQIKIE